MRSNIAFAHHNAIAGRDQWRNVRALIVVGRTLPGPDALERMAEARSGSAVALLRPWYKRADAEREMADGSAMPAEADRHPDPLADAIRWQICEGELLQIIGRGRGVNRMESDPLDVLVLTDVPIPLPIAETLTDQALDPTLADRMLAAGGVAFASPDDAARAYPNLWPTREAAKKAFARSSLGTFPYEEFSIGVCPQALPLRRLHYQVAGPGPTLCGSMDRPRSRARSGGVARGAAGAADSIRARERDARWARGVQPRS
jgi:putative DNA primase/helicase